MFRQTGLLRARRPLAAAMVVASLCGSLPAVDDPGKNKEEDARREEQSKKVQRSAAQYTVSPAGNRKQPFKFHPDAVMKWSNPVGGAKDGAIYVWSDRHRPQAIIKLFSHDGEHFTHEWQSLAEGEIVAERDGTAVWNPTEPGITFRTVPDAPKPAETSDARLRQMKSLAGKFSVTATRLPRDAKPTNLRLLVRPLFRFETGDGMQGPDGALFGFAEGTDPVALLLIEARRTEDGDRWHYAFARMTSWAVTATYGEKEVYSVGKYDFGRDANGTFLPLFRQPVPKE